MKIIKVESCFMCPLSDSFKFEDTLQIDCRHDSKKDVCGYGEETGMGVEGIWDKCPLEDYK